MKNEVYLFGLLVLLLASAAPAAAAPTADFQGNCQTVGNTVQCNFDPQRGSGSTCPGSSILSYSWDFGDGTGGLGGIPTSHTYSPPLSSYYPVTLLVSCADGTNATRTRYVCIYISFWGCILNNRGWN